MKKSPFAIVLKAAAEEARQRGDRRIGTEHLFLGLLHDPESAPAQALNLELTKAYRALDELDSEALAAIGIEPGAMGGPSAKPRAKLSPGALTSGARAVVNTAIKATTTRTRAHVPRQMLLTLLERGRRDPAAELIAHLDIDKQTVRARLET